VISAVRCLPKPLGDLDRINLDPFPPAGFVAHPVEFAMVGPAERHDKLIAHFTSDRPWLCKSQMMRIGWLPTTDETGLGADELSVRLIPHPA
jgi:hypothetical protein